MTEKEMNSLSALGKKLRFYRLKKNLSQEKVAELIELDRTYISSMERGKRNPSFLVIQKITKVLEVQPNDLFI